MSVTPQVAAEVGPMVSGYTVETAVERTLRAWLPAYICEAERKEGLTAGDTAWPKGWAHSGSDLEKMAQDQLPCVVIMSGGIVAAPVRTAMPVTIGAAISLPAGNLAAIFGLEVASVFNAAWDSYARRNAQLYAVAVRDCLLQRPLGMASPSEVVLRGENYDPLDFERTRTYAASIVSFDIAVDSVAWTDGGPPPDVTPPTDPTLPFDPWPVVQDVEVQVVKQPIDAPIP